MSKNKVATTLSIASGKGGVGKTTLAVKLSLELSQQNFKVLLIDCDYNLSNTFIKLNLPIDDRFYLFLKSKKGFFEVLYKIGNLHIFPGCSGNIDLFENDVSYDKLIMSIISEYERFYDYIILDSYSGTHRSMLNLNAYSNNRIIVATPDKSSITDAYSLIKILKMHFGIKENYLLINRYVTIDQCNKIAKTLQDTAKMFLGCSCKFIGGIQEWSKKGQDFDNLLLYNKKSPVHADFARALEELRLIN